MFEEDRIMRKWDQNERAHHINILECIMILQMCITFGPRFAGLRVVAWCDNMVSVRAVNRGVGQSEVMNSIIRRIRLECIRFEFVLWVRHIPGIANIVSDGLLRGVLAQRITGWFLTKGSMEKWRRLRGPFEFNMYADVNGRDKQADGWFSS